MTVRVDFVRTDGADVPIGFIDHMDMDIQAVLAWYATKYSLNPELIKEQTKYKILYFKKSAAIIITTGDSFDRSALGRSRQAKLVAAVEDTVRDFMYEKLDIKAQEQRVSSPYPYVRTYIPVLEYQVTISCSQPVDSSDVAE